MREIVAGFVGGSGTRTGRRVAGRRRRLARSQSSEVGLLACGIGAYFSLCDTPAGTFERAWLVSPPLDLERYI